LKSGLLRIVEARLFTAWMPVPFLSVYNQNRSKTVKQIHTI